MVRRPKFFYFARLVPQAFHSSCRRVFKCRNFVHALLRRRSPLRKDYMKRSQRLLSLFIVFAAFSSMAIAQCSESEDVHSVPTRPTFSTGAETTQCGVVEFDAGGTVAAPSGGRYWSVGDSSRLGITDHLDMRVASDSIDHLSFQSTSSRGIGDTVLNPKYRFNKESAWMPSFAAAYAIKLPTADATLGLGTGQRDQVFSLLASKSMGRYHVD